jgi:protein arginine N-methyltransferase 1
VRAGDVVLDAGAGTGILSLFACEAGARRVYAIEQDHVADVAAMFVRQLGYADRITLFHAKSIDVTLPEPADVLVTETLGALVFDEGFLATMADARRRLITPGARIIPSRIDVWLAPVELPELYAKRIDWWRTPRYGFDASAMQVFAANTTYTAKIPPDALLAAPATALSLRTAEIDDTAQHAAATFRTTRPGTIHGFALGFTATLADGIALTNAPGSAVTSWDQGFLPLESPVGIAAGAEVAIDLRTDNGRLWHWRGTVGEVAFEQTTVLSSPPCVEVH